MKIRRVYFALMALLLLPVTAMAQLIPTPAEGTAAVVISVFFNDEWTLIDPPPTTVSLTCAGATVAPSEVVVTELVSLSYEHAFVLSNIVDGGASCKVTASTVSGFTTEYGCNVLGYNGLDGDCDPSGWTDDFCQFDAVDDNEVAGCVINHNVDPVEVAVTKSWEFFGAEADYTSLDVGMNVICDAKIYGVNKNGGVWTKHFELDDEDYGDDEGEGDLEATVTVWVYPDWYPTAPDPDDQDYTLCWATEDLVDSSIDTANGCGYNSSNATVEISVGDSEASCTITNTVFFEGIPTLNQYGMAIMALLMLGVGFVGFRRFV